MVEEREQKGRNDKEEGSKHHHLTLLSCPQAVVHLGVESVGELAHQFSVFPPHSLPANSELASIPAN